MEPEQSALTSGIGSSALHAPSWPVSVHLASPACEIWFRFHSTMRPVASDDARRDPFQHSDT